MQKLYTMKAEIIRPECTCGDGGGKFAAMAQGSLTALARKPDDAQESPKGNAQAVPAKSGYAAMFRGAA